MESFGLLLPHAGKKHGILRDSQVYIGFSEIVLRLFQHGLCVRVFRLSQLPRKHGYERRVTLVEIVPALHDFAHIAA